MCFVLPAQQAHAAACTFTSNATGNWSAIDLDRSWYRLLDISRANLCWRYCNNCNWKHGHTGCVAGKCHCQLNRKCSGNSQWCSFGRVYTYCYRRYHYELPNSRSKQHNCGRHRNIKCGQHCYSRQRYWRPELYSVSFYRYDQCYRQYHVFRNCRAGTINVYRRRSLNIGGNFGSGGTLTTGGNGTIKFNGSAAQTIGTYTTFNNVEIANTSGGVTLTGTTTFGGTLVVDDGATFTVDAYTLTVTGTTTVGDGT